MDETHGTQQCTARTPVAWGDYRCQAPEGHKGYHGANGWSWGVWEQDTVIAEGLTTDTEEEA